VELLHGWLPSVAEREGAQADDVLARRGLPTRPGALHADADQGLGGGLDGAAADRETKAQLRLGCASPETQSRIVTA
jgi:hypothetical protein